LPTAADGAKVNIGVEWRQLKSQTTPDAAYQAGEAAGQGSPTKPVGGTVASREAFFEARVPLIDDKPFAKSLAFDTGYRYSDYSLGFTTSTYKFGLESAPSSDIRFRSSFAERCVHRTSANSSARSSSVSTVRPILAPAMPRDPPCSSVLPRALILRCTASSITTRRRSTMVRSVATLNLKPETATTKSFGVGLTPSFIPNLRVQVDYYDIDIKDVIGTIGADNILNLCLKANQYCDRIHRDVNGSLWLTNNGYVIDTLANSGALKETGYDFDVSYNFNLGKYGKLRAGYIATMLSKFETSPIAALPEYTYDCVGLYGTHCRSRIRSSVRRAT
jgi:outer membrane receptor protein involved in Fe transport